MQTNWRALQHETRNNSLCNACAQTSLAKLRRPESSQCENKGFAIECRFAAANKTKRSHNAANTLSGYIWRRPPDRSKRSTPTPPDHPFMIFLWFLWIYSCRFYTSGFKCWRGATEPKSAGPRASPTTPRLPLRLTPPPPNDSQIVDA